LRVKYFLLAFLIACGPAASHGDDDGGDDASVGDPDGDVCKAPEMLLLLDRTGTMHRDLAGLTPPDTSAGHAAAKLTLAINALDGLLAIPGLDGTLRLGLAMFPRDPGGGACLTLTQRLQGMDFTNPACEAGQVVVPPALGTAAAISGAIDPEATTLCFSTPTGSGLETAHAALMASATPGIDQYITLVTDGADFYDSCPTPDPMQVLRDLDAAGIKTFIVGFGAQDTTVQGVNPPLLNRMACAGHTAKDFATACMALPSGGYDAVDPNGARLYYDAADGPGLSTALKAVAGEVCCGCIL
jgi:hypothetical protein